MPAPTSWLTFLHLFGGCFNAPSQFLFEQLVTAWALCPGRRTLTRLWSVMPPERRRRYGALHLVLRPSGDSGGASALDGLTEEDREVVAGHAFGRYFDGNALFGSPQRCHD